MAKLFCAIVGEAGSAFEVKIDDAESVSALKEVIAGKLKYTGRADKLQLFLAKKNGVWLRDNDSLDAMLRSGTVDTSCMKMRASWKLNKPRLFGPGVSLGEDVVHVLVVVPKDAGVGAEVGVALIKPSAPPTTTHRHPERLKRWAAINTMIRQKNQDANAKTTSKDGENTNKKRKKHDIDRSMGYSNLCWEDIKPIYNFETYKPQVSDVPDPDIDLLLAR
ncbi:hypothetical protein PI126_g24574, partial [Phytophthora idaei]